MALERIERARPRSRSGAANPTRAHVHPNSRKAGTFEDDFFYSYAKGETDRLYKKAVELLKRKNAVRRLARAESRELTEDERLVTLITPAAVRVFEQDGGQAIELTVEIDGHERVLRGHGNGPIHAAVQAFASAGIAVEVHGYEERSMAGAHDDGSAKACAIVEVGVAGRSTFGVGVDANIVTASIQALCSGVRRASTGN